MISTPADLHALFTTNPHNPPFSKFIPYLDSLQGYNKRRAYIIAEGPMEHTVRNWYKMVCDNKCGAVVMLSGLTENNKVAMQLNQGL